MSETTRVPFNEAGVQYLVAPDDIIPEGMRTSAIAYARVIDELTLAPVSLPISVTPAGTAFQAASTRGAVNPRAVDGGIIGLVGTPARALPALASTAYDVGVSARAAGYVSRRVTKTIGPIATFPATFTPRDLGDLELHREPVMLYGRTVVRTAGAIDKLATATIRITGIWRAAPTLTVSPPAAPADIVALDPPLYTARPLATLVRRRALTPNLANEKRLQRAAVAGATEVFLPDRKALVAGDLLGIDESDLSRAEWVKVKAIVGSTNVAEPAVATLEYPLAHGHGEGARAHPTTIGGVLAAQAVSLDAIAGDTTLLLGGLIGLTPFTVELDDGVTVPEYHRLSLYEDVSDPDGQWRLPPLSRVAQVTLTGTHAMFTVPPRTVTVEYPRREQRIDFTFS
jgi:hypothetical protein